MSLFITVFWYLSLVNTKTIHKQTKGFLKSAVMVLLLLFGSMNVRVNCPPGHKEDVAEVGSVLIRDSVLPGETSC